MCQQVSSEEAVKVYIERCQDVNPIVNAIVEARYDAAIEEAQTVDEFLSQCTKTEEELAREMPLLGLPVTVKESIAVQGSFDRSFNCRPSTPGSGVTRA